MAKRIPHSESADWFWPRKESTWLKLRDGDITATAAAALFGVSPYMTPFDLYHRLARNVEVVFEESERMRWGKRLQDAIAEGICQDNGWEIVDAHPFLYARSRLYPGLGASPDFVIRDRNRTSLGLGLLEIKNVDKFIAKDEWEPDEAPVHIEFQIQQQLEVCGLEWGAIGGLVGGNETKVYRRERDHDVGRAIGEASNAMFARVAAKEPPAPDYLADANTIRALYRFAEPGKSRDLGVEPDAEFEKTIRALADAHRLADAAYKNAKEDKEIAAAKLLDTLRDVESVFAEGLSIKAPTVMTEASTVERKASTYRRLYVKFPTPKKAK